MDIVKELKEKLTTTEFLEDKEEQTLAVILNFGYRYVSSEKRNILKELIEEHSQFFIERFDSNVISKEEAETWFDEMEVKTITQIVRSGQVVEVIGEDRKSTRLNSSHVAISYAVFC